MKQGLFGVKVEEKSATDEKKKFSSTNALTSNSYDFGFARALTMR